MEITTYIKGATNMATKTQWKNFGKFFWDSNEYRIIISERATGRVVNKFFADEISEAREWIAKNQ